MALWLDVPEQMSMPDRSRLGKRCSEEIHSPARQRNRPTWTLLQVKSKKGYRPKN